ncbi:MAG: hypothetical protein R2710_05430 [Acidimicrobiales bacterium]
MAKDDATPVPVTRDDDRRLDLIVFGATSFVGQILCRVLVERHGVGGRVRSRSAPVEHRWAQCEEAGRGGRGDRRRSNASWPTPRVPLTWRHSPHRRTWWCRPSGPMRCTARSWWRRVRRPVPTIAISPGEPQWMRRMIDAHQATAEASGARIVHSCGFDSIPSDLGVAVLQAGLRSASVRRARRWRCAEAHGGRSEWRHHRQSDERGRGDLPRSRARKLMANPYALAPEECATVSNSRT